VEDGGRRCREGVPNHKSKNQKSPKSDRVVWERWLGGEMGIPKSSPIPIPKSIPNDIINSSPRATTDLDPDSGAIARGEDEGELLEPKLIIIIIRRRRRIRVIRVRIRTKNKRK
jgi:hypothetical protein